jgi:energy-coupling factor transporter transmembrane protein EcfT
MGAMEVDRRNTRSCRENIVPTPVMKDPTSKLITVGCIAIGTLGPTSSLYLWIAACGYLCWTVAAGIRVRGLTKRLRGAFVFLLVVILVNGASESGRVLFEGWGLYFTLEGLEKGLGQGIRLVTVLWGAWLLVSTTSLENFLDAGERWTRRKGRPLLAAGTIALIYLPILVENARRIVIARRARGESERHRFPSGITRAARGTLPLFAVAMRSADALAEAMEARCYESVSPRTPFRLTTISPLDVFIALCVAGVTAVALVGIV